MDFDRMESAVEGALLGGWGATKARYHRDRKRERESKRERERKREVGAAGEPAFSQNKDKTNNGCMATSHAVI